MTTIATIALSSVRVASSRASSPAEARWPPRDMALFARLGLQVKA